MTYPLGSVNSDYEEPPTIRWRRTRSRPERGLYSTWATDPHGRCSGPALAVAPPGRTSPTGRPRPKRTPRLGTSPLASAGNNRGIENDAAVARAMCLQHRPQCGGWPVGVRQARRGTQPSMVPTRGVALKCPFARAGVTSGNAETPQLLQAAGFHLCPR